LRAQKPPMQCSFEHKIEIGIMRPEQPGHNADPDDPTAPGWQSGFPAEYGWREWKPRGGASEWHGPFVTPEDATAAAECGRDEDPELGMLPIVRIDWVPTAPSPEGHRGGKRAPT
jgi:hypothetical protein